MIKLIEILLIVAIICLMCALVFGENLESRCQMLPVLPNVKMVNSKTYQPAILGAYYNWRTKWFSWSSTPFEKGDYIPMPIAFDTDSMKVTTEFEWKVINIQPPRPPTLSDIKRYWLNGTDFRTYARWANGEFQ
jgi:hypothetical protein